MTLITKLKEEMVLQSLLKNTQSCYEFWNRKFCSFVRIPAREWTGRDVRAFMLWLYEQNYSAVSLRHGFTTHLFEAGCDPVTIKDLLGHEDFNTTMIYAHGDAAKGFSPLDFGPRPVAQINPLPALAEVFA